MRELISIAEPAFLTIQGEGALVGRPTVFVRTGGCDFRCAWCDSMHAVDPANKANWRKLDATQVLAEVAALTEGKPILITLSGGNPALQPLASLIDLGHERGYKFALETQGSIAKTWFHKLDYLILSPKPPSSGMSFREPRLEECIDAYSPGARSVLNKSNVSGLSIKVVVMTEEDYNFARSLSGKLDRMFFPQRFPFFLTPGNHTPPEGAKYNSQNDEFDTEGVMARTRWLVERVSRDKWFDVSIIPQIHTLIWGNKQGV